MCVWEKWEYVHFSKCICSLPSKSHPTKTYRLQKEDINNMLVYNNFKGRNRIGGLLRIWIAPVIRCLLLLVKLFLIGLGLGDSRLVIPSLLFFAPFLFCNYSIVWFSFMFFVCFLLLVFSKFALCSSRIE